MSHNTVTHKCAVCDKAFKPQYLRKYELLRPNLNAVIAASAPSWGPGAEICKTDLRAMRAQYIEQMLATERGELSDLDRDVIESMAKGEVITQDLGVALEMKSSFGERAADKVAAFGGSWTFILSFSAVLIIWMMLNVTALLFKPFDCINGPGHT